MSKYEVDGGFADGESEVPLLMVVPELGVDQVQLELQSLALDEVSVGQGGRGLGVHQGPVDLGGVAVLALQHPGDAQVEEAALGDVHVDGPGLLLFGEEDVNGGIIQRVQADVKLLGDSQFSGSRRLRHRHWLEVRGEEELVEVLPLSVRPGPVAEVSSPATLDVQTPGWGGRLHHLSTG